MGLEAAAPAARPLPRQHAGGAPAAPFKPGAALRATARQMRRRLEVLRAAPRWLHACADGDALDLDAWVRHSGEARGPATPDDPRVFKRLQRGERSLATLLLADLSLSTDAHVNNEQRVIDVIRDALFVFRRSAARHRRRLCHARLQLGAAPARAHAAPEGL
jgi:nitric oxide reductase NorD protein